MSFNFEDPKKSSRYTRPKGVMGGPCQYCQGTQPEHAGLTCDEVRVRRKKALLDAAKDMLLPVPDPQVRGLVSRRATSLFDLYPDGTLFQRRGAKLAMLLPDGTTQYLLIQG